MSVQQLLYSMCADLPDADLNAIRKVRGFGVGETASRTSFASFYITPVGLENAIRACSLEETLTLRLLHETGEVDISFFERLYGGGSPRGTYTQQFKSTFDTVKKNLVRRGLVVMAEVKMRGETVALERWRFALPAEFVPYLPPLPAVQSDQAGQTDDRLTRKKLLELIGGGPAVPKDEVSIEVKLGSLYLKGEPFSVAALGAWQIHAWESALHTSKPDLPASLSPVEAVLKLLGPDRWTAPKAIEPALKIYCWGANIPPADQLLRKGWELGLISRLEVGPGEHYRLANHSDSTAGSPAYARSLGWADPSFRSGSLKIDLRLVPLTDLELLNRLAHLSLENGSLIASPSLVKVGRAAPDQRSSLLARWLAQQSPAFGTVFETVKAKWGRTILHENLLVARVRDLSLRIQLERELKDKIVLLSDHFIAFPLESRAAVEKVLKKSGFVVKTIKSS